MKFSWSRFTEFHTAIDKNIGGQAKDYFENELSNFPNMPQI
jgi:hypothetical protein